MKQKMTNEILNQAKNYCLVLNLPDPKCLNNGSDTDNLIREYQLEAFRCIKYWRKNAGWLKDIKIIVDYSGENEMEEKIESKLKSPEYDATINYSTFKKSLGFFDVHFGIKNLMDNFLTKPIIIHIDLDMILLKEIPKEFFEPLLTKDLIIGGYNPEDYAIQRSPIYGDRIYNTNLIINKSKEYSEYNFYKEITDIYSTYKDTPDYYLDETLAESTINMNLNKIHEVIFYEMGEGYSNNLEHLDKIYFWEEHIYRDKPKELNKEQLELKFLFNKVKKYFKLEKINAI